LVRVQARVRARRVRMTVEGQAVQKLLDEHRTKSDLLKEVEVLVFTFLAHWFDDCLLF